MFIGMVQSILTKILTIAGALLVQRGLLGSNDMEELAVGLGMLVASVAVSWYRQKLQNKTVVAAIQAPPTTTVEEVLNRVKYEE